MYPAALAFEVLKFDECECGFFGACEWCLLCCFLWGFFVSVLSNSLYPTIGLCKMLKDVALHKCGYVFTGKAEERKV